ncbi:MAG TPA: hypothetical protein VGU64_23275 [Terriglobales bacterium]|nr:hypothetical protein [Terriglobales bacterium]
MCDYSLHNLTSRLAKLGDKLTTRDFGTGTRGFAASEDQNVAVCIRPGTELSFAREVTYQTIGMFPLTYKGIKHNTAIFRQINKERIATNHDALEFPDGQIVLLTCLREGQVARVLQLPAEAKTAVAVKAQRRAAFAGLRPTSTLNLWPLVHGHSLNRELVGPSPKRTSALQYSVPQILEMPQKYGGPPSETA